MNIDDDGGDGGAVTPGALFNFHAELENDSMSEDDSGSTFFWEFQVPNPEESWT